MSWKRTGVASGDLREGLLHGTTAGSRAVVLVRLAGEVHAIDGTCPHLGGDLAEGTAEQGKVTCPLHGATFDLLTGAVRADPFGVSPPEGAVTPVATYPVRITDGTVEVDVPDG
jgi:nitrite reductase/ring-hydroxylating ferredoxin subunit